MESINSKDDKFSLQFVLFILILSSTLFFDSYFGFNGLVPIGITVSLLIGFFLDTIKVRLNDLIIFCFFIICSLLTLVLTFKYWNADPAQIKNFLFLVLGLLCYLIVKTIINKLNIKEISDVINPIILFHIFILYIQLFCYYLLGYDLNVGQILGGEGHRAFTDGGVYRPTGVFDEPAIYSVFCAGLILIRLFYNKKLDWIVYCALLSIFITLSFVGFLLAGAILIIYSSLKLRVFIFILMLIVTMLVFSPLFEGNYVINRIEVLLKGNDGSTNSKFLVISDFLSIKQLFNFGYGYIGLREWTPNYYDAIYDLTFYVSLLVEFGFYLGSFLLFLFFISLILSNKDFSDKVSFLIILIKLTATHFPFLWIVFAFFYSEDNSNNKKISPNLFYKSI